MIHFKAREGHVNDPNGPCFWKGNYHMFFQHLDGRAWAWGHAVSRDLLHWEELPDAILPAWRSKPGDSGFSGADSCWSGAVCVEEERVVAAFYGHGNEQTCGIYVMTASDPMLCCWENVTRGPVIPSVDVPNEGCSPDAAPHSYDSVPYCTAPMLYDPFIWVEDGVYHLLSGGIVRQEATGGMQRQEFLFTSRDLIHWEYRHPLLTDPYSAEAGDDGACPYFMPWKDGRTEGNGHRLLLHFSHQYGPRFSFGYYDQEKQLFTPYSGARIDTVSRMDGYCAPALFDGTLDGAMLAVYVMHGRGVPSVLSMVHRLERCGEYLEDLSVSPAADLDQLPYTRNVSPGEEGHIDLKGDVAVLRMRIGYSWEKAFPILFFHRADGTVFGSLRLSVSSGSSKKRFGNWSGSDHAVLDLLDRPDAAPPNVVQLPAANGIWELTLVADGDCLEIFFPGALSIGRRMYGDLQGMYLSLSGGKLLEK